MNDQVQEIFVEDIIPNRFQPRLTFDEKALQELSDSIKVHGVIQPLVLRKAGNKYEIIAGERRYKASCMAGLKKVPAIVREMTDNESAEIALIENIQRKNLSSIEEAQSYKNLLDRGYSTQEDLANKLGVSQPTIANKLRLLNLCDEVQNALLNEQISERHARSLLQLKDPDEQKNMLNKIIKERLTVKQLDNEIKKKLQGSSSLSEFEQNGEGIIPNMEGNNFVNGNSGEVVPNKNIFGISIEPPTDLETSAPNLNFGVEEPVPEVSFNPFSGPLVSDMTNIGNSTEAQNNSLENIVPFGSDSSKDSTFDNIETFDMFGDIQNKSSQPTNAYQFEQVIPQSNTLVNDVDNTIHNHNVGDQITTIRDSIKKVEGNGFKVDTEEYDFQDVYQIIIKIKK